MKQPTRTYINVAAISTALIALIWQCDFNKPPGPTSPTPAPSATPALDSYLHIHPKNSHYFEAVGKPVLIASHGNLVPSSKIEDQNALIKFIVDSKQSHTRVWHLIPWDVSALWPWARSTTTGFQGISGGNKYDFLQWNKEYFDRLHDNLQRTKGIHSEIMLFDRVGMSPPSNDRWQSNPWASDNNINGLETKPANSEGTPEFYDMVARPKLFEAQKQYVQKLVDETIDYTVFYEIENEHWARSTTDWANFWGKFVHDYASTKHSLQVLVSYNSLESDLDALFTNPNIDIINKHYGGELEDNPDIVNSYIESHWNYNKPINIDEFGNGVKDYDLLRKEAWIIVMSGGHFHIEDADPASNPLKITESVRNFITISNWDFIGAHPQKNFSAGGYCMVGTGEYACYFPQKGPKTFNIPAGNYIIDTYDTVNAGVNKRITVNHPGGNLVVTPAFDLDWVIHIKSTGPVPSTTPAPSVAQCVPKPPVIGRIQPSIYNRPSPGKVVLDTTPKVCDTAYCSAVGFPGANCCPTRPEGDPLRAACDEIALGHNSDGVTGPQWTNLGAGEYRKHPNPYMAFYFGNGKMKACSNLEPIVCGEVEIKDNQ